MSLIERAAGKAAQKKKVADKKKSLSETAVGTGLSKGDKQKISEKSSFQAIGSNTLKRPKDEKTEKVVSEEKDDKSFFEPRKNLSVGKPKNKNTENQSNSKNENVQELDLIKLHEAGYITPDMPPSLMSEEFRLIKRTLLLNAFSSEKKKLQNSNVVLTTSCNPGEGKTFFSINLALSIASETDVTVLLVDADFSKPEVLNRLGVSGGKGLMDVVADNSLDIGDCFVRTNIPNLVLLPAGRQNNLTTELLASDRMKSIVTEMGNRYNDRLIIFDSPPVLASSAASVLALYMGQTVFVIEAEKTTEPQIKESLNTISACPNINLVLNKTRFSSSHKKFAIYYGYGGRK